MAKPGPAPMPTKLKMLTGNRGKRPLNKNEPEPEVEIQRKPKILQGDAATEWYRLTKEIYKIGCISRMDTPAIVMCCMSWARYLEAERKIKEMGPFIKSPKGYPIHNPWISILKTERDMALKIYMQFGGTAVARSQISIANKTKKKGTFK